MNSTRTTTIGIAMIALVFFSWMIFSQPKRVPPPAKAVVTDSFIPKTDSTGPGPAAAAKPVAQQEMRSALFPSDTTTAASSKFIETPLVSAVISSHGGNIISWVLKNYKTFQRTPLELVDKTVKSGDVNLIFKATDGRTVSTKDLPFTIDDNSQKTLGYHDSLTIRMVAKIDSGASIEKIIHIYSDKYAMRIEYHLNGLQNKVGGYRYALSVDNPIPYNEAHTDGESQVARAFSVSKVGSEEVDASKNGEVVHKAFNGDVEYVAARTQYFLAAMIPETPRPVSSEITGNSFPAPDGGRIEHYVMNVSLPIASPGKEVLSVEYYLGPLEYERLTSIAPALDGVMDFGWRLLVRPISIYVLFPFFMWLHGFISNWGLVIIVFSIMIKLVTMPFTRSQMQAMRKMQALQPLMTEVREKYKDDQKKQQEETFKMYRTYGVNPAGGCLPMILQMPILFALYAVLRNVIELRQAPFVSWINDLSVPDALFKLGTHIPIIGDQLSGLTLLMGITMVVQSAFQTTDPRQKTMAYIMPIFFTFLFNNLPSGVALYYFMFNIFGIAQQVYNKQFLPPLDLEALKMQAQGKKGFMSRMQDMEKNARKQRQDTMAGKKPLPPKKKK